jgi:hypothetical protein
MIALSPFSLLNNYKVLSRQTKLYNLIEPTPQEIVLFNVINSCGVIASFQAEKILCSRKKLKSLSDKKVIVKHKLESPQYRMNVFNFDMEIDLNHILKRLAFAQLYTRIREITPCKAALCPAPLTGMMYFNGVSYPVLVLRKGDNTTLLKDVLKTLPRVLVIAEEVLQLDFGIPYRLTTDGDILTKPLRYSFYNESGEPEEATQFPEDSPVPA